MASPAYQTTVVVSADRPHATASERAVDARTIALTSHHDAGDLLVLVPGLWTSQHGAEGKGQQIFLRGFDAVHGSDVEISFGGVPINELSNVHGQGYVDLGFLIPEAILAIDSAKGPFRVEQGNFATAGSVSFRPGVAREQRGTRVGYELGTSKRHRVLLLWAPPDRAEDELVAVEAMRDDGFGGNRGSERASLLGQLRLWSRGAARLELLGSAYGARFGEPGVLAAALVEDGRLGFRDAASPDTHGASRRGFVVLRHTDGDARGFAETQAWLSLRDLALEENFTGFLLDAERGDRRLQVHRAAGLGLRTRVERKLPRRARLVLGASAVVEAFEQAEDQIDATHTPWQRNRELSGLQAAVGTWAGARWTLAPWLKLDGGARLDLFYFDVADGVDATASRRDAVAQVSPRLAALFPLTDELTLFAAYGRGVRAPEARAITGSARAGDEGEPGAAAGQYDGGPARSTSADGAELGVRFAPSPRLELAAAGFVTRVEGELIFDHVSGINVELNRTRRLGAEVELSLRPVPWLSLRGDATLVDARFVDSGAAVPGAPTFLATFEATAQHPRGLRAGLRGTYLAPRPLAHGARAHAVGVVDLVAGWRFRALDVQLGIDNLLGADWREGEYHFASWFDQSQPRSQLPATHFSPGEPLTVRASLTAWF